MRSFVATGLFLATYNEWVTQVVVYQTLYHMSSDSGILTGS